MALEVGTAYVSILPSAKGFGQRLKSEIGPSLGQAGATGGQQFGQEFGKSAATKTAAGAEAAGIAAGQRYAGGMGKALKVGLTTVGTVAAGVLTAKLTQFALQGANYASDLIESANKMEVVFGDASKGMIDFANRGTKALGMTEVQARDAAATFGVFGKAAQLTGGELEKFGKDLTGLVPDLASFHNADPSDVIVALGSALRGEYEGMRRFGVLLDDATMKQKAMEMGIISSTKNALTPQQKTLAAYSVIMEQTTDAQGDFAKTWDESWANQKRTLEASVTEMAGTLGKELLPVLSDTTKFMVHTAVPAFEGAGVAAINGAKAFGEWPTPLKMATVSLAAVVALRGPLSTMSTLMGERLRSAAAGTTSTMRSFGEAVNYAQQASQRASAGGASTFASWGTGLKTFTGQANLAKTAMNGLKVAGSGLMSLAGGPLGLALTAVSIGIGVWMDQSAKAKARQDELKASTQAMTDTLVANGGAWDDNATKQLLAQAATENVIGNMEAMNYSTEFATRALVADGAERRRYITDLDAQITKLQETGAIYNEYGNVVGYANQEQIDYYSRQKENFLNFTGSASTAATEARRLIDQQKAAGASGEEMADGMEKASTATEIFEGAAAKADTNLRSLDTLMKQMSGNLDFREAQLRNAETLERTLETIKKSNAEQGKKIALSNDEKGALYDLARSNVAAFDSLRKNTEQADVAAGKFAEMATQFYKTAVQAGATKEEARKLTDELYLIPNSRGTTVSIFNKDGSIKDIKAIRTEISKVPSQKLINFQIAASTALDVASRGPMGGFAAVANFGFKNSAKMARGGILPGYTPGRDVHRFFSPTGGFLELSGGEAILRPEVTRALGEGQIHQWNADARAGKFANGGIIQRFARGGVLQSPASVFAAITAQANTAGVAMRRAMSGVSMSPALAQSLTGVARALGLVTASSLQTGNTTRLTFTRMVTDGKWAQVQMRSSLNQQAVDIRWLGTQYTAAQSGPIRTSMTRMVTDSRWTADQTEVSWTRMKRGLDALNNYFFFIEGAIKNTMNRLVEGTRSPIRTILNEVIRDKLVWSWNAIAAKVKMDTWSFPGYDTGGWTGPGTKYQPAGVVHADEYVIRKESTNKLRKKHGLGFLDAINQTGEIPGYARGGLAKPWPTYVAGVARKLFPGIGQIGGYGSRPGPSDHGSGNALDFMVPDSSVLGDNIAAWGIKHRNDLRLKYIIWKKRIIGSRHGWGGWAPYTRYGNSKNRTLQHYDHPHFSFVHDTMGNPANLGVKLSPAEVAALLAAGGGSFGPNPEAVALKAKIDPKIKAAGGVLKRVAGMSGDWGMMASKLGEEMVSKTNEALQKKIDEAFPAGIGPDSGDNASPYMGAVGKGVEQWRDTVLQALSIMGQPASLANTVLRRMNQESGGNPNAVNNWDINAKNGVPSKGLMQVIAPTYSAYKHPGYNKGLYDPLSNILASMRYALGRYGSLTKAYNRKGGYSSGGLVTPELFDTGGILRPGLTLAMNATGKNETIRTYEQEQNVQAALAGSGDTINIYAVKQDSVDELADALNYAIVRRENRRRYGKVMT